MPLKMADFLTEHRLIVLIDIRGYSELSDDEQLEIIQLLTKDSLDLVKGGGYKKEEIFACFIPTGDGFYVVGDDRLSLIWSEMCVVFAVSLRNALLQSFQGLSFHCQGVRIAVHVGTTQEFQDIAGHTNFVGAGMNETARLLSPTNADEIAEISRRFYSHENSVIVSQAALDRTESLSKLGFRLSDAFTIQAKHDRLFPCRFVDLPLHQVLNIFSAGR